LQHDLKTPLNNIKSLIEFIEEDQMIELKDGASDLFNGQNICKFDVKINWWSFILFKNVENNEGKLDVQILAEVDSVLKLIRIDNEVIIDKINLNHRSFQPIAFKQIIQNLISNAIKYNDKAVTKITITTQEEKRSR
jgi:signal transduction histidine kinase